MNHEIIGQLFNDSRKTMVTTCCLQPFYLQQKLRLTGYIVIDYWVLNIPLLHQHQSSFKGVLSYEVF